MNPHIDSLLDSRMVTTASRLRSDVDSLKAAQRSGARSLRTFVNQSAGTYNFSSTLAPATTATFTVTFTSAIQKYALADLTFRVYVNSLSNEVRPNLTSTDLWPNPKVTLSPPTTASPFVTTWTIKLFGVGISGSNTNYVKLYVQSTDTGVIAP